MAISSPGLGSNLDVNSIVSQLMAIESRPITTLDTREVRFQAKLSAYGTVKGAFSGFQSAVAGLNDAGKFLSLTATSSDNTLLTASATSVATPGNYTVEITKLAQSQKLVATGTADSISVIGNGTLTFDFGTLSGGTLGPDGKYTGANFTSNGNGTKTVTINSTNNSLQGIRDAINTAGIGITASIVNDGSDTPYRLTLMSNTLGKDSSIKVSVSGDAALSSLLAHNPAGTQNLSETATAQNAEFKVNGIAASKTSNTISDVIQGVTLNLVKAPSTSPITVSVARNTTAIQSSIQNFVTAYNELNKTLGAVSAYDPVAKKGAVLQGDATVRTLQAQMRTLLNKPVEHTGGVFSTLSQIGVTFQKDGLLSLDVAKLNAAVKSHPHDIASLFASTGKPTDSLVSYISAGSDTSPGTYELTVSQLAARGRLTGSAAVGSLTITQGVNDALSVTVDGINASVTLGAGTYNSLDAMIAEVQTRINGASNLSAAGISVSVAHNSNILTLTSNQYGATSRVLVSGSGASNLLGSAPTASTGTDIAGAMNGIAATGSGQFLSDIAGGLTVQVTGGSTGPRGTVNYSNGYATALARFAASVLSDDGQIAGRTKGINSTIEDIGKQRETLNQRLTGIEKRYRAQFTALDVMLSNLTQTSSYLTQQLDMLRKLNSD